MAAALPVAASALPGAGEADAPVAERRVCSMLFCDVAGFAPLSESRDPEAVRELPSGYFAVAQTVIGRYGEVVADVGKSRLGWGFRKYIEGLAEQVWWH